MQFCKNAWNIVYLIKRCKMNLDNPVKTFIFIVRRVITFVEIIVRVKIMLSFSERNETENQKSGFLHEVK